VPPENAWANILFAECLSRGRGEREGGGGG